MLPLLFSIPFMVLAVAIATVPVILAMISESHVRKRQIRLHVDSVGVARRDLPRAP